MPNDEQNSERERLYFLFADDSEYPSQLNDETDKVIGFGGLHVPGDLLPSFSRDIEDLFRKWDIPTEPTRETEVKWSTAPGDYIREAIGDERQEFFEELLSVVDRYDIHLQVSAANRNLLGQTEEQTRKCLVKFTFERFAMQAEDHDAYGIAICDESGPMDGDQQVLREFYELKNKGTGHVDAQRVIMNVLTTQSRYSEIVQTADVFVSVTTSLLAGKENDYNKELFVKFNHLFPTGHINQAGTGLKLWPDKFRNMYHWLLGTTYYKRFSAHGGGELPTDFLQYANCPFEDVPYEYEADEEGPSQDFLEEIFGADK